MNVLFLTLLGFDSIKERSIYTDLLGEFAHNGHNIYAVSPVERKEKTETHIIREEKNITILRLKIGNTQKTNIIEKGISTVMIGPCYKNAIRHYFSSVKFDLILYTTPPITLVNAIDYIKKRDGAKTYLLLKDIFPQNAVDMGMMSKTGIKGLLYRHFRKQEKRMYLLSDRIGCMSQANVDYVIAHNPEIDPQIIEVCPNSIDPVEKSIDRTTRDTILKKYDIPLDKKIFIYGGNLGKPQGIPFLIECMQKCYDISEVFFLIIGDGTEYHLIDNYINMSKQQNIKLMRRLPKEDYDTLVSACDVGMIFLSHRFSIPNYPSRLLSYMQAKKPVLAVTDPNTDVGKTIVQGSFGWWCESNDSDMVKCKVLEIANENLEDMGINGYNYLITHFTTAKTYKTISKGLNWNE